MSWIKRKFGALLNRSKFPKLQHEVKYAFTCDGTDYFQFVDFNNIPALRGLKTMVFYEEMKMKCTLQYLEYHVEAVDKQLSSDKINIYNIKKLNDQLKQRLDMALDTELIYKLASIIFFDKQEDVSDYDFNYNQKKVEKFKKGDAIDFFLLSPVQELLPVLKDIGGNLKKYSQAVEAMNGMHLENLLQMLPETKTRTLKGKSYFSVMAMPQE